MKNNKILIIVILIIIILGLSGFIIYDKVLKNNKSLNTNNQTPVGENKEIQDFDIKKAEKILDNYKTNSGRYLLNLEDLGMNNLVADKAKGSDVLCGEVFSENEKDVYCNKEEKVKSISYNDFLNKKKELFGDNVTLKKESFQYGFCGMYKYVESSDSFVFAGYMGCGEVSVDNSGVKKAYKKNDKLYIYAYESSSDETGSSTYNEYVFTFNIINGKYILKEATYLTE